MREIEEIITLRDMASPELERIAAQAQELGRPMEQASKGYTLDRCPACHQLLVTCLGCGRHRGAWKDPTSRAHYCSDRCRATAKQRRHRRRALTQA